MRNNETGFAGDVGETSGEEEGEVGGEAPSSEAEEEARKPEGGAAVMGALSALCTATGEGGNTVGGEGGCC